MLAEGRDKAAEFIQIFQVPPSAVSKAAKWLINQQNNVTGVFREVGPLYNKRFMVCYQLLFAVSGGEWKLVQIFSILRVAKYFGFSLIMKLFYSGIT